MKNTPILFKFSNQHKSISYRYALTNFRYKETVTFNLMDIILQLICPSDLNSLFSNHITLWVHAEFQAN